MTLPIDIVLVRHGESEANLIQNQTKINGSAVYPEAFYNRHDSQMRLSPRGVEQAKIAGDKLRELGLVDFDNYYVSPHVRTFETAGHLRMGGNWRVDDRLRERDWGEYGIVNDVDRARLWPHAMHLKELNEWYWAPPGGEALASGVRLRVSSWIDTLHRKKNVDSVLVVDHGELHRVAQFVFERMTPASWAVMDKDKKFRVRNTMILQYTRRNPFTGEISKKLTHTRAICPWDESLSWNNGEWREIPYNRPTDDELLQVVEKFPRIGDYSIPASSATLELT